jgi:hypothetical protein
LELSVSKRSRFVIMIMDQKQLPETNNPLVVRIDFENQRAWKRVCKLIRAPVPAIGDTFYAYVQFLDDVAFRGLGAAELLARVPSGYKHSFLLVVDSAAINHPEFAILVIDLRGVDHRQFRAIPAAIQSIENNLSIANLCFSEFADAVDEDGIFRGFPTP